MADSRAVSPCTQPTRLTKRSAAKAEPLLLLLLPPPPAPTEESGAGVKGVDDEDDGDDGWGGDGVCCVCGCCCVVRAAIKACVFLYVYVDVKGVLVCLCWWRPWSLYTHIEEKSLTQTKFPLFPLPFLLTFNAGGGRNATMSPRRSGTCRRLVTPSTTIKSPLCWDWNFVLGGGV